MTLQGITEAHPRYAQKPTAGRFLCAVAACLLFLCALSGRASGQESPGKSLRVTEKQAVQRALEQRELNQTWTARVTSARARAVSEGAWPNPTLSYTHEQSYEEPDAVGEDFVVVEQQLPLSGRRALEARAAHESADAVRLDVTVRIARTAAEVRRLYYQVLYLRRRIGVRDAWLDQMRELEQTLERRVEAGETASYDLERLRREIADIVADIEVERADLAQAHAELRGLLFLEEEDGAVVPTADLMPGAVPSDAQLVDDVGSRPEVEAARKRVHAARLSNDAASRWWIPEPTVTGGYRGASVGGQHFPGFVLGLSLALPIFNQNAGERLAARARVTRAKGRLEIVRRRYESRVRGLAEQTRRLRRAARTYREEGVSRSERVSKVALTAYEADEIGILELLDAYRGMVDARLRALQLARKARTHEIELRKNLGRPSLKSVQSPSE